ncbi:MAG: hypothetical protein J1G01_05625 [Clostridiales bacterium]|nr:hypothetical protein [Clostridiales bacterium]
MISVIYGAKGSGKTKRIIDAANLAASSVTGQVIFITDNSDSLGIAASVRFINLAEFDVKSEAEFIGFLKGMLATNFDIQKVFIDGMGRFLSKSAEELKTVFQTIEKEADKADFIATVSTDTLPAFLKKYAAKD